MGPISSSLGVNHDNDIIYILLNPVVSMAVTGVNSLSWTNLSSNSCDATDTADVLTFYQIMNGCDPNQYPYPDIVGIPVWCLKNPYYPGQGCAQWLQYTSRSWDDSIWLNSSNEPIPAGLTLQDFADILQADPFVSLNGNSVNVCHPKYGPDLDPNDVETISSTPITLTGAQVNPTGSTPISCWSGNPAAGTSFTNTRFLPYGTVEYPVPGPNGLPSTYTGKFQYSQTNQTGQTATDTHTTSTSVSGTLSFGDSWGPYAIEGAATWGTTNSQTWQQQTTTTNSNTSTTEADYSITGPQSSDNYTGPATYNVYWDNVYGTYAFYSDLEAQPNLNNLSIGISSSKTSQVAIPGFGQLTATQGPTSGYGQTVYLTNNSSYPITMVWPAVTFNDPGFQIQSNILNDGSDHCSNQVLQAGVQCAIAVMFAPVVSDAPNNAPYTLTNTAPYTQNGIGGSGTTTNGVTTYPVNATLIAAGTANISYPQTYQNILVTNQAAVSGTAAVGSTTQGATLYPTPIQNLNVQCPAPTGQYCESQNIYQFPPSNYIASPPQTFTFTNYYSSSVTITKIVLSDTSDFSFVNNCTTVFAPPSTPNSCTITVQFLPTTPVPPSGVFTTQITAMGTVAGSSLGTIALAFAGASGTVAPPLTATAAALPMQYYTYVDLYLTGWAVPFTLTNNASVPVTFNYCAGCEASIATTSGETVYVQMNGTVNALGDANGQVDKPCVNTGTPQSGCVPGDPAEYPPTGDSQALTCNPTTQGGSTIVLAARASCLAAVVAIVPTGYNAWPVGTYNYTLPISGVLGSAGSPTATAPVQATATVNQYINDIVIKINGTELSKTETLAATNGKGRVIISAVKVPAASNGDLYVKVGTFNASAAYSGGDKVDVVAKAVAAALNVPRSPVTAEASGSVVKLTSVNVGSAGNFILDTAGDGNFAVLASGATLTGGKNATTKTTYDSGIVNVTTGGVTASAAWGKESTPQSIAKALAVSINKMAAKYWKAEASGDVVTLTSIPQTPTSFGLTVTDSKGFTPTSFGATTN
jgi:hypothetical protein